MTQSLLLSFAAIKQGSVMAAAAIVVVAEHDPLSFLEVRLAASMAEASFKSTAQDLVVMGHKRPDVYRGLHLWLLGVEVTHAQATDMIARFRHQLNNGAVPALP